MKLSELVTLYDNLSALTMSDIHLDADQRVKKILFAVSESPEHVGNFSQTLDVAGQYLSNSFEKFESNLTELKAVVKEMIRKQEPEWLQKSYIFYEKTLLNQDAQRPEAVTWNRNRRVPLTAETEELFRTRLLRYSDWRYPAMIIHPMNELFVGDLVSSDPLYLVDESRYLLEPAMSNFNELYQRRLRPYVIQESFDDLIFDKLPDNQFGLCLAYNHLNYRPFEIIKKYLTEIYLKLRPGGIFVLTFNDCDRASAVSLVEQNYACYTPSYLVEQFAQTLGYEIIYKFTDGGPSTWLELQRPGQLTSLRGGQVLAKIMPRPGPEPEPAPEPDPVPEVDPMIELRNQVLGLNRYDADLVKNKYSEEKLRRILEKHAKKITKSVAKSK